jgi:hypothetical protein
MVHLTIRGDRLKVQVRGLDRLWAMRRRLDVPLASVRSARVDHTVARGLWKGVSAPGTHIPGFIIAGTFYQDDERIFWDVHRPDRAVVIELSGHRYDRLVVEVGDPEGVVEMLESAIRTAAPPAGTAGGGDRRPAVAARNE